MTGAAVAVGLVVNLVFLGSTLVGPVVATRAARDALRKLGPASSDAVQ